MVVTAGRPSFDLPKVNQTAGPGTYMIKTGIDFSVPNIRYLIGLAQPNTTGGNSPVGFVSSILTSNCICALFTDAMRPFPDVGEQQHGNQHHPSSPILHRRVRV